jgi:hypothetical protein
MTQILTPIAARNDTFIRSESEVAPEGCCKSLSEPGKREQCQELLNTYLVLQWRLGIEVDQCFT